MPTMDCALLTVQGILQLTGHMALSYLHCFFSLGC